MPFGKELTHLIEEQINRASGNAADSSTGVAGGSGVDEGRIALIEANLQRLAEKFASYLGTVKKSKRNVVEYGLEVIALHGLRLAVTAGRGSFVDKDEPLDMPYTYLQLSSPGTAREIRYIYLSSEGLVFESTTDPTNIGLGYMPLALIDVWSGAGEITPDKIKDIRPRAGVETSGTNQVQSQLTGNVTLQCPDTGNDSFIVSATSPAGLQVNVTSGRALIDGEVVNAEGGLLNLADICSVEMEYLGLSDGVRTNYDLYHKAVANVAVYVDDIETTITTEPDSGSITFATPPPAGAKVRASYTFAGNSMLVFLVEKVRTNDGHTFGVIGWKIGSNRSFLQPPQLAQYQHAIAKVDMSSSIAAITDDLIDNSYEIKNINQVDLQRGGRLDGSSIAIGAITGDHIVAEAITGQNIAFDSITGDRIAVNAITSNEIAANTITGDNIAANTITSDNILANTITGDKIAANAISGDKIAAGCIDAAKIISGSIMAEHIAAGAITSEKIAAEAITADMIQARAISADKLELSTWGDLSQAMRFVKSILGGQQAWKRILSKTDLAVGVFANVSVSTCDFPAIRLDTTRHWDDGILWDDGFWDIPVYPSGYWESASFDYGEVSDLQAEFWAVPYIDDPAVTITAQARYSSDNLQWSEYETLVPNSSLGYLYWTGLLQPFRYFKVRLEFSTSDTMKYALLGNPEVRAANCKIGTEDLSDGVITLAKLSPDLRNLLGI